MRLRPGLVGDYRRDAAVFRTGTQKAWFVGLVVLAVFLGFGGRLGPLGLSDDVLLLAITALFASIGAIGLNIVTGYAGQVSLGHAFFLGIGAYTAAVLGGAEVVREGVDAATGEVVRETVILGLGLDMLIWLPAAGLLAALLGLLVAPVATRLRGLYLAFVTLGLVILGDHIFREAKLLTGGAALGRETAELSLLGFRFDEPGEVFGVYLSREHKLFLLALILLLIMGLAAKNLARSRVGRALAAIRDRDIAAEIMGIPLARYKLIAFTISSFYAGIAGALLWSVVGRLEPQTFGFLLSVRYIAMILIGGVATIAGSIMGAFFLTFLPKIVELLASVIPFISKQASGGVLTVSQAEQILYGLLIVGFLILEPLGLYGIWIRVRNYWKAWPFSY